MNIVPVPNSSQLDFESFRGDGDSLYAFASDLLWSPGYFPERIALHGESGVFRYARIKLDHERAVYYNSQHGSVVIFND